MTPIMQRSDQSQRAGDAYGRPQGGFTLLELLVSISIIVILAALGVGGFKAYRGVATGAQCSSNLRQLSAAMSLYQGDHMGDFVPYVQNTPEGRMWYFGLETGGGSEGDRDLDQNAGPLYPYILSVGSVEVCQGFNYGSALWKAKFKGASYGYGYNWWLGGRSGGSPMNITQMGKSANIILFGDCGQVNTFQAPASKANPMIEEFYIINESYSTVHFRHGGRANILFVDGHVESFRPYPGTEDTRVEGELLGRITKKGSYEYIK